MVFGVMLSYFQGRKCKGGKGDRQKPKTHHHLRLTPAGQVKMMMQRGASKNALAAGVSEIDNLQHYAHKLHHEYAADD